MDTTGEMQATDYHAKYYAALLQERHSLGDVRRLLPALVGADVVHYPHQLQAALFALRSPVDKGVVLADEQGLGKTVQAALVLATYFIEGKKSLILCAPQRRMQHWRDHLTGRFGIPVIKLSEFPEKKGVVLLTVGQAIRNGYRLSKIKWDACVMDEAHRIATAKAFATGKGTGHVLRRIFCNRKTILLTSMPIQSGWMDIYYLLNMVDHHAFGGGPDVYQNKYVEQKHRQGELRRRVRLLYHRNLARHVPPIAARERMPTQKLRQTSASDDWDALRKKAMADGFSVFDSQTAAAYKEYTRMVAKELPRLQNILYELTKYTLLPHATFHDAEHSFVINSDKKAWGLQKNQRYRLGQAEGDEQAFYLLHPLSQKIIAACMQRDSSGGQLTLRRGNGISRGTSGVMGLWRVSAFAGYDKFASQLLMMGRTDDGAVLNHGQCEQLMQLPVVACQYGSGAEDIQTQTVSGQDKVELAPAREKMIQAIKNTMQKQMQQLREEELQKNRYYMEDRLYGSQLQTRAQQQSSGEKPRKSNEQLHEVERTLQRSRWQASRKTMEKRIKKEAADENHALQELTELRFKQDELFMLRFTIV